MTTKFRTDLVNYGVGISVAVAVIGGSNYIGIGGKFGDKVVAWIVICAMAIGLGWAAAWIINWLQGQSHQKALDANEEEKRSAKGAAWATIIIAPILIIISSFVKINPNVYGVISLCGIGVFLIAFAYWGVPALLKRLSKK